MTPINSWEVIFVVIAVAPFSLLVLILIYGLVKLSQDSGKDDTIAILNWVSGILKSGSSTKLRRSQYFLRLVRCSLMSSSLGNATGYPGVFQSNPHPYPSKPVPAATGPGFDGYGLRVL